MEDNYEKERLYYHVRHRAVAIMIEKEFPHRFEFSSYTTLGEVERKILKSKVETRKRDNSKERDNSVSQEKLLFYGGSSTKRKTANGGKIANFLILHPNYGDSFIDAKLFKKIIMLGKS